MHEFRSLNVLPLCHPLVGVAVDMPMAYSTDWLLGLAGMVTAFTVILFAVLLCSVGAPLTAAPSPFAMVIVLCAEVVGL